MRWANLSFNWNGEENFSLISYGFNEFFSGTNEQTLASLKDSYKKLEKILDKNYANSFVGKKRIIEANEAGVFVGQNYSNYNSGKPESILRAYVSGKISLELETFSNSSKILGIYDDVCKIKEVDFSEDVLKEMKRIEHFRSGESSKYFDFLK